MAFLDNQGVSKLCALLKDKFDNVMSAVNRKQDALTAGANITINNGVISAADTDTIYTAGTGINIDSNNEISCIVSGGSNYTAGNGISIDENNVINRDAIDWSEPLFSVLSSGLISNFNLGSNIGTYSSVADLATALKQNKIAATSPSFGFTSFSIKDLNDAMGTNYAGRKFSINFTNSTPITNDYFAATSTSDLNTGERNSLGLIIVGNEIWCVNSGLSGLRRLFGFNLSQILQLKTYNAANYTGARLDAVISQLDTAISTKLTAPTDPSTDGTYKLTSTITSGTPTYSWEADSGSSGGGSTETIYPGNINSVPYGLFWDGSNIPAFQEGPAQNQENLPYFKISDMSQLNEGFAALRDGNLVQFYQPTTINLQDYVEQIFGPQADIPTWNSCLMMWFQSVNGVMQFDVNGAQIYDSQTNTINRTIGGGTFAIKIGRIVYVFMNTRRAAALEWLRNFYNIPMLSSNSTSLPAAPSVDGNYILKCSVASGTPTYSWESVTIGGSY